MFQTFTGSSRKPRQVNLSSRRSDGNALLFAQQERERRQRDRDRQNTAKLLQRLWRGHSTRGQLRQRWRDEWDAREHASGEDAYQTQAEALEQLQRLLHFVRLQDEEDVDRLRRYVMRLRRTLQNQDIICAGGPWPMAYLRLRKLVLTAIPSSSGNLLFELETVAFIGEQIPDHLAQSATQIYQTLAGVVHRSCLAKALDTAVMAVIVRILTAPLLSATIGSAQIYEAFACDFLTLSDITESPFHPIWLDSIAEHVDYKILASALAAAISSGRQTNHPRMKDSRNRLSLLATFIYFHRFAHRFQNAQAYSSHRDFVHVISVLLSSVADDVNLDDLQSEEEPKAVKGKGVLMNPFAQDQIISLVNQESIGSLLWGASNSPARPGSPPHMNREAKQLANYALTLLRFFPRRGDEIRMWLYLGSTSSASLVDSGRTPAIKFFWQAARSCMVFNNISRDPKSVIRFLKPQPDWEGQTNREHTEWVQDDWRVILVFLELYTFVLKLMDDEEFFSVSSLTASQESSSWARYNALPLEEIRFLTVFLKNLGFTMYFHAKEIVEEHVTVDEVASLSSYFKVASPDRVELDFPSLPKTPETAIAGLSGISIDYVKGLVTGLLRMVHERDSRRKFLPPDHWLMTSLFDMTSFIPDVVAEEENRHRIQEEDDEDYKIDEEMGDPQIQLVGTTRDRSILYHERLERQQRKASRKRYLQTVAPRSEILQNMPFFIPFTTRVQIFREFVRRDQVCPSFISIFFQTNSCFSNSMTRGL
jgi:ubiquitin-protein ligase E3 C